MAELLSQPESRGIRWGVVTNKSIRLTRPLLAALKVDTCCGDRGGDSAAAPKPAPDPLFLACSQASVSAANCIYVGDHERDIVSERPQACALSQRATDTFAEGCGIEDWRADVVISQPLELLKVLECR